MPGQYTPGEPLDVTIRVIPAEGVLAYAVEESLPAGWSVSQITEGGVWDAGEAALRWGP